MEDIQKLSMDINKYLSGVRSKLQMPEEKVNIDEVIEVLNTIKSNLSFQKLSFLDIHDLLQNSYSLLDFIGINCLDQYDSEKIKVLQSSLMDLVLTTFRIYFGNMEPKHLEIMFKNILENLIPKFATMENRN